MAAFATANRRRLLGANREGLTHRKHMLEFWRIPYRESLEEVGAVESERTSEVRDEAGHTHRSVVAMVECGCDLLFERPDGDPAHRSTPRDHDWIRVVPCWPLTRPPGRRDRDCLPGVDRERQPGDLDSGSPSKPLQDEPFYGWKIAASARLGARSWPQRRTVPVTESADGGGR